VHLAGAIQAQLRTRDMQSAQRLCRALAASTVSHEGRLIRVTASIGVSQCGPDDETIEAALRRADEAMYEAKRAGRNRVVVHGRRG
jgi:diguanylate cyclase (GGDEF)-like protein